METNQVMSRNKVDPLNVIRFFAFFIVFMLHAKIFAPGDWNAGVNHAWMIYTPAWAGVWIFLFLSGYGIGHGFTHGKYELNLNGILNFYLKRLVRLLPVYLSYLLIVFVFVSPSLILPTQENLYKVLQLLTFNYAEGFDSLLYGAAWYLSTLVKLYLIAPLFYFLIKRFLSSARKVTVLILVLFVFGIALRFAVKAVVDTGLYAWMNWSASVYKPFYMNLDLFFIGFLLTALPKIQGGFLAKIKPVAKALALPAFFALIVLNCYLYYHSVYQNHPTYMMVYQYVFPSAYVAVLSFNVYFYDLQRDYQYTKLSCRQLCKNPLRIFDYFNLISLPAYLFHSNVFLELQKVVTPEFIAPWAARFHLSGTPSFAIHLMMLALGFIITILISTFLYQGTKRIVCPTIQVKRVDEAPGNP